MYNYLIPEINYYMVFGTMFGIYFIIQLDTLVRDVMNFVKGWRQGN